MADVEALMRRLPGCTALQSTQQTADTENACKNTVGGDSDSGKTADLQSCSHACAVKIEQGLVFHGYLAYAQMKLARFWGLKSLSLDTA